MVKICPMRKSVGNGISANGSSCPKRNRTSEAAVACFEKTEKLIPRVTTVAPSGYGDPGLNPYWLWKRVGKTSIRGGGWCTILDSSRAAGVS